MAAITFAFGGAFPFVHGDSVTRLTLPAGRVDVLHRSSRGRIPAALHADNMILRGGLKDGTSPDAKRAIPDDSVQRRLDRAYAGVLGLRN